MSLKQTFELLGRNVFAAGRLEQVFLAPRDGEKSVGIQRAQVSGAKPAIQEGLAVVFGQLVVTGRDVGPAYENFFAHATFLVRQFLAQLYFNARDHATHASRLDMPRTVHGDDGRSLRQAVTFIHGKPHGPEKLRQLS